MSGQLVQEAQNLVSGQLGCDVDAALLVLDDVASATEEPLEAVAELVISGEVRFDALAGENRRSTPPNR
jgi:hypothetical protein